MAGKNWIQGAIKHPGALHRALGIPAGQKIPMDMMKIQPGDSPQLKKEKTLAKTLSKMR